MQKLFGKGYPIASIAVASLGNSSLLLAGLALTALHAQPVLSQATPLLLSQFREASPKELVDEVWQITDRSYIDGKFNGQDWKAVREKYLGRSYKSRQEAYTAIDEMLKLLGDPATRLIRPADFSQSRADTASEITGIGVQIAKNEQTQPITVVTALENSPAMQAGIKAGDVITQVDGKKTEGMEIEAVTQLIRGPVGTSVTVTVLRNGKPLEFRIARQWVQISPVTFRVQETAKGKIGYIRLSNFNAQATQFMSTAIENLEKQNVKGYVFDLRSNSGGLTYSAIDVTRMWLNNGTVVKSISRDRTDSDLARNQALTNKPLVVLVNDKTAAVSEIVASALQENQRAILVGIPTVGANRVQSIRMLGDGSGLAVTTSKWLTAKGRDIYRVGVKPDVVAALTDAELRKRLPNSNQLGTSADPQYAKAIEVLERRLAGAK